MDLQSALDAVRSAALSRDAGFSILSLDAVLVTLLAIGVVCYKPSWRIARYGVTLIHEYGHVVLGLLVGRKLEHIIVRADTSGETATRGPRGPSTWIVASGGYPAPGVAGVLGALALTLERSGVALVILGVASLVAMLWCRGFFTFLVLLAASAVSLGAALAPESVRVGVLLGITVLAALGGLRAGVEQLQGARFGRYLGADAAVLGWNKAPLVRFMARLLCASCLVAAVATGVLLAA